METAQKLYTAWHSGDIPTVMSLLSDDVILYVWNPSAPGAKPGVPMSGVWKNKDGVGEYMKVRTFYMLMLSDDVILCV